MGADDSLLTDENTAATVEVLAVSTVGAAATGVAALNAEGTIISVSDADYHDIATFP